MKYIGILKQHKRYEEEGYYQTKHIVGDSREEVLNARNKLMDKLIEETLYWKRDNIETKRKEIFNEFGVDKPDILTIHKDYDKMVFTVSFHYIWYYDYKTEQFVEKDDPEYQQYTYEFDIEEAEEVKEKMVAIITYYEVCLEFEEADETRVEMCLRTNNISEAQKKSEELQKKYPKDSVYINKITVSEIGKKFSYEENIVEEC